MRAKIFISMCLILSILSSKNVISHNPFHISNQDYIATEDGIIRMYINVLGHVKSPGSYLVYDKIDFMSAISIAGGYSSGANLSNVYIYGIDGTYKTVNLNRSFERNIPLDQFVNLKPHDTIYIKEKTLSKVFTSSNLPYVLLGILNVALTLNNN